MTCWMCDDTGHWHTDKQTLICPICHTHEAEHQSLMTKKYISWCGSMWPIMRAKYFGYRFQIDPWLLVIHSGWKKAGVAEYFQNPKDGRKVSAHICYSEKHGKMAQCVPLSHAAFHVGGSRFKGKKRLNFQSIGIELPGPVDKNRDDEIDMIIETVEALCCIVPSLTTVVCHSDIDSSRSDPGKYFDINWLARTGLKMPFKS